MQICVGHSRIPPYRISRICLSGCKNGKNRHPDLPLDMGVQISLSRAALWKLDPEFMPHCVIILRQIRRDMQKMSGCDECQGSYNIKTTEFTSFAKRFFQ
jgi:hypothetical protein